MPIPGQIFHVCKITLKHVNDLYENEWFLVSNFDSELSLIFRCAPDWESNQHLAYTIYWLLAGFLIPLFVILYCSGKTIFLLKKVSTSTYI